MGYIYLLRLYPSNLDNIYKLGRTSRDILERYNDYKQDTVNPEIIFIYKIDDNHRAEKELLIIFKQKYTLRKDFGKEYFTGDINDMIQTMLKYLIDFENINTITDEIDNIDNTDDIYEFLKDNYKISNAKTIQSWIIEEKNEKGVWRVDWSLVGNNYIECSKIYSSYLYDGMLGSKILLGKKLKKMGIIVGNKNTNSRSVNVYIGISDNIKENETQSFDE